MEVTHFLQRINRGQRRSASDHWNFEKIPISFEFQRGKAINQINLINHPHLKLLIKIDLKIPMLIIYRNNEIENTINSPLPNDIKLS